MRRQRGYLMMIAAYLLVVSSFIGITIASIITNKSSATLRNAQAQEALDIASAGLNRAVFPLITTDFTKRISCSEVTGESDFTNVLFGSGVYTVTATAQEVSSATLTSNVTNSATVIPVSSLTDYLNSGRILINAEAIDYTNTSTVDAICGGTAPCFINATRAQSGTTAMGHISGSPVVQQRCLVESTGSVPDETTSTGKRVVSINIFDMVQGWGIGNTSGGDETILHLTGNTWTQVTPSASIPNVHLYGLDMLNAAFGFIVGQKSGGSGTILKWDGTSWAGVALSASIPDKDLNDVICIDGADCWAVGDTATFLHWDGSAWSNGTVEAGFPGVVINGISCLATDDCWSVGGTSGGDPVIAQWDGIQWARVLPAANVPNKALNGVDCIATDDCWAVGAESTFVQWDGVTWSNVNPDNSVPDKTITDVVCLATDYCWASGFAQANEALIVKWDGVSWDRVYADDTASSSNLQSISCSNANNCWTTGDNNTLLYWNGSDWTDSATPSMPNTRINKINMLSTKDDTVSLVAHWSES